MTNKPRIYWDTCVFLAWIKGEKREAGAMAGVEAIAAEVFKNNVVILTSVITRSEIPLVHNLNPGQLDKFERVFGRSNVQQINVDPRIAKLAGDLRAYYRGTAASPELGFADALHLATAIQYKADKFQTFDGLRSDCVTKKEPRAYRTLLPLTGNVAGYSLVIEIPRAAGTDKDQGVLDLLNH